MEEGFLIIIVGVVFIGLVVALSGFVIEALAGSFFTVLVVIVVQALLFQPPEPTVVEKVGYGVAAHLGIDERLKNFSYQGVCHYEIADILGANRTILEDEVIGKDLDYAASLVNYLNVSMNCEEIIHYLREYMANRYDGQSGN